MAKKIKSWMVEAMVKNIEEGNTKLEDIKDDRLRRKVAKHIAAASQPATVDTITLTGTIKRESEKAILFVPSTQDTIGEAWWPKSQIKVYERAMGPCDQIAVPAWLASKKTER